MGLLWGYTGPTVRKKALKVYLSEGLLEWLRREAQRRRCSMGQVVRDLIVAEMDGRGPKGGRHLFD